MENPATDILLIEDNPNDAEMTIRELRKHSITNHVTHLVDGVEGLNFIFGQGSYKNRNIENKPMVILLDLKMPKVDGMEVLHRVKSDERTKTIPIVALVSCIEDPAVRICYNLGVNGCIVKPVGIDNFNKTISELGLCWPILNQIPK